MADHRLVGTEPASPAARRQRRARPPAAVGARARPGLVELARRHGVGRDQRDRRCAGSTARRAAGRRAPRRHRAQDPPAAALPGAEDGVGRSRSPAASRTTSTTCSRSCAGRSSCCRTTSRCSTRPGPGSTRCNAPPTGPPRSPTTSWRSAVSASTNPSRSTCTSCSSACASCSTRCSAPRVTLELELDGDRGHDRRRPEPPRAGRPQPRGERARRDAGGWSGHDRHPQRSDAAARLRAARSPTPVRGWTPPRAPASSNRSSPPSRRGSGPASACRPPTTSCAPPAAPSRSTADARPRHDVHVTFPVRAVDEHSGADPRRGARRRRRHAHGARRRRRVRRALAGRRDPAGLGLPRGRRPPTATPPSPCSSAPPAPSTCS